MDEVKKGILKGILKTGTKLAFFFFPFFSSGQLQPYSVMSATGDFHPAPYDQPYDDRYPGAMGNPMLFDSWTKCNVYNDSFLYLEEVLVNYDLLAKKLLIIDHRKKVFLVGRSFYTSIIDFQGRTFWLKPDELEAFADQDGGAVEILIKSNSLLALRKKKFIEANFKSSGNPGRDHNGYVLENEYFLRSFRNPSYTRIRLSPVSVKEALSDKEWAQAEQLIREYDLKLDNEASMIYLVQKLSDRLEQ